MFFMSHKEDRNTIPLTNMLSWKVTLLLFVLQILNVFAALNGETLVVGDSWAALSQNYLGSVCSLSTNDYTNVVRTIRNDAKSGSTAFEWKEGETAKKSFENGKDYDFVWLSAGGNDFLGTKCLTEFPNGVNSFIGGLLGESTIANYVVDIIADIVESTSNPDLMILFTGYGYPTVEICPDGDTIDQFNSLNEKIRNTINSSAYRNRVMTIDISDLFVTSVSSPFSDATWYADDIHINEAGYDKLFSLPEIQSFFQCTTAASAPPTSIPTFHPTSNPTLTTQPSESPSLSTKPSVYPSVLPSMNPTVSTRPSSSPSFRPSYGPTVSHMPSVSSKPSSSPSISSIPSNLPSVSDSCGSSSDLFFIQTYCDAKKKVSSWIEKNKGAAVGIALGAAILVILGTFLLIKRRRNNRRHTRNGPYHRSPFPIGHPPPEHYEHRVSASHDGFEVERYRGP